jgi:heme/copper-type cytochrome/quinol oxidase subunit 2
MELTHEPEPTAEAVTEARYTLRIFWKLMMESMVIFLTLAAGWIIGNNPSGVFGVAVPNELNWLTMAVFVAATVELVTAGVITSHRRKQKEPTDTDTPRKFNPVVAAIGFVFITGLFITLFFGYLIMRNAMLAV